MVLKRGVGVASMWYGIGNTGMANPSTAAVRVGPDGTVTVYTGAAELGQGSDTVLAQIAAEELGVPFEAVKVVSADTGQTPDAGATSASRQTYISGNAVRGAASEAKRMLYDEAAIMLGVEPREVEFDGSWFIAAGIGRVLLGEVVTSYEARGEAVRGEFTFDPDTTALDPETGTGSPYAAYAFATHIAEVEVDIETGEVRLLRLVAAHDVGRAVNPPMVEGQIEGGVVMGLGYALTEDLAVSDGGVVSLGLKEYLIPTAVDAPEIHPIIVEGEEPSGPFGAKGVGEPALIPAAAAISNAIWDAVKVRVTRLPIRPWDIVNKLQERSRDSRAGDH